VPDTEDRLLSPEQRAGRAEAKHEVLLEALGIFAHDLSNPLQSLIVLTEVALDDAIPGSDDHERNRQSLEAVDRMKILVQGLAGLTRSIDGPRNVAAVVERLGSVLSRRWERARVQLSVDLGLIERTPTPLILETAMLSLGLGVVTAAQENNHPRYDLSLRGITLEGPRSCAIELTLTGHNAGGSGVPVALSASHLERTERLFEGDSAIVVRSEAEAVLVEFSSEPRRP